MKKTILLMIGLLSVVYSSNGQQIGSSKRDSLVDYVNCEYVKTYCAYCKQQNKATAGEVENYNKKILPTISNNSIKHPVNKDTLSNLLNKNGWKNTNEQLVEQINRNKLLESCVDSIVSTACLSNRLVAILEQTKENLNSEIDSILKSESQIQIEPSDDTKDTNLVDPVDPEPGGISVGLLIILLVAELFVIIVIEFLLYKIICCNKDKKHMGKNESVKYGGEAPKGQNSLEKNHNKLLKENSELKAENRRLKAENSELKDKIDTQKQPLQPIRQTNSNPIYTTSAPIPIEVKYLKTAMKGVFYNTFDRPNDCYFKVFDIDGNNAKFEFCGDGEFGIANRDALFDNVCNIFGSSFNAHHIKNEKPGTLESIGDGQWKVIEKAQIKFEE